VLAVLAAVSLAAAGAIGVGAALAWTLWLLPFVAFGVFIAAAYTLELFGGRFHGDAWFALAWGAFPVLTAYVGAAERLRLEALLAAAAAALLSLAQRELSTQVRAVRRETVSVSGAIAYRDGRREPLTATDLVRVPETALRLLAAAVVTLAVALVVLRLA
jgi:hypothetical protein